MIRTIEIKSLSQLEDAAQNFIKITQGHKKFAFYGTLGSGKTTLIKAICKELGAVDIVTSPSFALINEYRTTYGTTIFHIDLYRITTLEELFDLGYEEYFYGDHFVFVEWPEKAEALMPDFFVKVNIEITDKKKRLILVTL